MPSEGEGAGVAVRPVMDLSDGRVIAYRALARPIDDGPDPAELLDAALGLGTLTAPAPLLVPVHQSLLLREDFDPVEHGRRAKCSPSEVVWMMPEPRTHGASGSASAGVEPSLLHDAIRRHSAALREAGFRLGLEAVDALSVVWDDVAAARPAFLVLSRQSASSLADEAERAALVGLLAFAGHLGARVVVEHIEEPGQVTALMAAGIFYGVGDHLHSPVVLDAGVALQGDLVVRPSWFRERSIRLLREPTPQEAVVQRPGPTQKVASRPELAELAAEWAEVMSNAASAAEVLEVFTQVLPRVVDFDRLAIFEANWDRYMLVPRVLIGDDLQGLADSHTTINTGITGWAFLRDQPYRCGRTVDHPEAAPIVGQPEDDESMLVIPMISGGRRLGVLDLWLDGIDRYSQEDLDRVAVVARHAAQAWRDAIERAELAERVVTDTATGLLNKRWWEELAPREAAQAERTASSIAVLLVDLDGFKTVNDSFGHAAGDAALKQVARALSGAVRSGDAVVRYGGDEFVLMLRDCDVTNAADVAADVRLALDHIQLPGELRLTASIGIAMFPADAPSLEEVAVCADAAMYLAKAQGGGRTAVYMPGDSGLAGATRHLTEPDPGVPGGSAGPNGPNGPSRPDGTLQLELEESHRRLRYGEQLAAVGSFEMDLLTGRLEWSDELRRIIGIEHEVDPTLGQFVARIHPDDLDRYSSEISTWARGGWGRFDIQLSLSLPGGETRQVHLRQVIRSLEDGRRVLSGTVQEVAT